jgi:hypothetical protein
MGARFSYSHLRNIRRGPFFSVLQNFAWNTHYEPNFGQNLLGVGVFDSHGKSAKDGPLRFLMGSKNKLFAILIMFPLRTAVTRDTGLRLT